MAQNLKTFNILRRSKDFIDSKNLENFMDFQFFGNFINSKNVYNFKNVEISNIHVAEVTKNDVCTEKWTWVRFDSYLLKFPFCSTWILHAHISSWCSNTIFLENYRPCNNYRITNYKFGIPHAPQYWSTVILNDEWNSIFRFKKCNHLPLCPCSEFLFSNTHSRTVL